MKYLTELIKDNNHKLVRYNKVKENHEYMTVFNYSEKYGGTYDSFRYYNDYVIEMWTERLFYRNILKEDVKWKRLKA